MGSASKIAIGVVIGIIVVIGFIYVSDNYNSISQSVNPTVTVTAVDVVINYQGSTSGYLGPSSQSLAGFSASSDSTCAYTISINTSAILFTHNINSITVNTDGFSISSISPSLPYSFGPGSTITLTLIINLPSSSYTGIMEIEIDTT